MHSKLRNALVAIFLVALSAPALAQVTPDPYGVGEYFAGLTREDWQLISAASAKLFANPSAEVGDLETWRNPNTGNFGSVRLIQEFESKGMPCRRIRHSIRIKGMTDLRMIEGSRCKGADGVWRVM